MYFNALRLKMKGGDLLMRFFSPIYPSVIAIIKLASVCSTRRGRREIRTRHRLGIVGYIRTGRRYPGRQGYAYFHRVLSG